MTPLVIFLLVMIVMLAKLLDSPPKDMNFLVGKPLPAINLAAAYEGLPGVNNEAMKGKYVLVNVFGSWCITCQIEHPFLMKLKQNNIIPIYGINWRDKPEALAAYLKTNGNPYEAIGNDFDGKTVVDLGVTGAPETLLISPEGKVLMRYAGPVVDEVWALKFQPLLGAK